MSTLLGAFITALPGLMPVALCYALLCAASPFGRCRACKGLGFRTRTTALTGRLARGRDCRRCDTTGRRLRLGRRLHNHGLAARERAERIRHNSQL
ncbi:hypothetical protein KCMC57_up38270 [Kitasatospora sp. CMC57]|uniref:Uncharacterized protein n=1 Tax=Kitasatospora sp. CMC57 TaxID=3231513 RepID=A0AB33JZK8_9ACTN